MNKCRSQSLVLLAGLTVVLGLSGFHRLNAQTHTSTTTVAEMVKRANRAADARYLQTAKAWNAKLASTGSKSRFRLMAKEIAGFGEKIAQGAELFEGKSTTVDRMRSSFRRHILDERQLAAAMLQSLAQFQEELTNDSTELYVKFGVDREMAASFYPRVNIDHKPWLLVFEPVLREAKVLAEEDWVRTGGVLVGSYITGDVVADVGRDSGLWAPEKGSFWDFATRLVTDYVVEEALDQITDPSDAFAERLLKKYLAAQHELLEGKNGFVTALGNIKSRHQRTRNLHFASFMKGGQ